MSETQLSLSKLRSALVGTRFTGHLHHFASVTSTNTLLLEAAASGAPEGTVYIADEQTAGRGRGGHSWHSAPGEGLYLSALAKPSLHINEALLISLATGLAAWQGIIEISGLSVDIRWPNDLLLNGKKVGGVLVETAVEPGVDPLLRYAVIGIGINVCQHNFPEDLAHLATSLDMENEGFVTHRGPLVLSLLRALDLELSKLEDASYVPQLLQRFTERSTWVRGKRVQVPEQGGYTGTTAGLDTQGFLLVNADDGTQRTVLSGGVRELNP